MYKGLDQANTDRDNYLKSIETDPLFRHEPKELFDIGAVAMVAGTIGNDGGNLEYNTGDWLMAKDFPARTRPMGSTAHSKPAFENGNFDMSDPDDGFKISEQNWFRSTKHNGVKEWRHSDIKDAPYVYIHKLYGKITG